MKGDFLRSKLIKKSSGDETPLFSNTIDKLFAPRPKQTSYLINKSKYIKFVDESKLRTEICPIISVEDAKKVKDQSLIDSEIVLEKFEKAHLREEPKAKKQNALLSLVFLAINILLVVFIAKSFFSSTDNLDLGSILKVQGSKLWWLVGAVVCLLLMVFSESAIFTVLIRHTTGKYRPILSYKTAITGKYYEAVTPLSVGAQPSQILYMGKRGVAPGIATSIPIIRLIVYNSVFAVISLLFFIFVLPSMSVASELDALLQIIMKVLACIGLIISSVAVVVIMIIATSKSFGKKLARGIIKLGSTLHLIKNKRKSYNNLMKQVVEFQSSVGYLKKNKWMLFFSLLFSIIQILAFISVPFFVVMAFTATEYVAFGEMALLWLECAARFLMCYMAASFVPIPGGTGMMEIAFICLFGGSAFIGATNIFWGFLTFRILTYYQWIVQGLCLIIFDIIVGIIANRHKARKQVKTE